MGTLREYKKANGVVSFHAEVRLKGHPPQRASFRTKSLAKKWIQDTESAIRDGRHFQVSEAKKHTVADLIDRFIDQWLTKFPDRKKKQTAYLSWWKARLGHLYLVDLRASVISEARDTLLRESTPRGGTKSPSTVNRYLAAFSKAITVAVKEWGWMDDSPMRKVSKPTEGSGRDRYLTTEEKDRLLLSCRASVNPSLYPVVSLALLTGMRFGEIIGIRNRDIDHEREVIVLHKTKNGERRFVPITPVVKAVLSAISKTGTKPDDFIFKSDRPNNKKGTVTIRKAFERALKEAKIEGFRFHDLRHTAASQLAMNGATQGQLMAILGHKSPSMTKRYAHFSQEHLREVLEKTHMKRF